MDPDVAAAKSRKGTNRVNERSSQNGKERSQRHLVPPGKSASGSKNSSFSSGKSVGLMPPDYSLSDSDNSKSSTRSSFVANVADANFVKDTTSSTSRQKQARRSRKAPRDGLDNTHPSNSDSESSARTMSKLPEVSAQSTPAKVPAAKSTSKRQSIAVSSTSSGKGRVVAAPTAKLLAPDCIDPCPADAGPTGATELPAPAGKLATYATATCDKIDGEVASEGQDSRCAWLLWGTGFSQAFANCPAEFYIQIPSTSTVQSVLANVSVELVHSNADSLGSVRVVLSAGESEGTIRCSYTPLSTGEHRLSVLMSTQHVGSSPHVVAVHPKPPSTTLVLPLAHTNQPAGLVRAISGRTHMIAISKSGEEDPRSLRVRFEPIATGAGSVPTLEPAVVDLGNGQYSVCYCPPSEGTFELSICRPTSDGWSHIADSPFMVHVDAARPSEDAWSVRGVGLWWAEVDTVARFHLIPPVSENRARKATAADFEAFLQTTSGIVLPTFHPSPADGGGFTVLYKCAWPGYWQLFVRNRMDGSVVSGCPTWVLVSTFEEQARALLLNALDLVDRMEAKQRARHRERRGKSALPIVARELVHAIAAIEAEDASLTSLDGLIHPIDLVGRLATAIAAGDMEQARKALSEEIQTANSLANQLGTYYAKVPSTSASGSREENVARIARAMGPVAVALRSWRSPAWSPTDPSSTIPPSQTSPLRPVIEGVPWLLDGESLVAGIARLASTLANKDGAEVCALMQALFISYIASHLPHRVGWARVSYMYASAMSPSSVGSC